MQILKGHISAETAYQVDDYPYSFKLRCKIRYWLEYNPTHGVRFVSQTTDARRGNVTWNKPKASTYMPVAACMYLDDEKGHVQWSGLHYYGDAAEAIKWRDTYGAGVPEECKPRLDKWITDKQAYEAKRAGQ